MTFRIGQVQSNALRCERMDRAFLVCPQVSWRLG